MLRIEAKKLDASWPNLFSPRNALWCNKLIGWRAYNNGTATPTATIATNDNVALSRSTACVKDLACNLT